MRTGKTELVDTDRNCTHLAGEYFVAAELYKRGYSVAITIGNAKAIDLYAEKYKRAVNIQVKAIKNKKSTGWPMMKGKVVDKVIYVFVCLNDSGHPPAYFVCTSREARSKVKQYPTRGIIGLAKLRSERYMDRWDKIESALRQT